VNSTWTDFYCAPVSPAEPNGLTQLNQVDLVDGCEVSKAEIGLQKTPPVLVLKQRDRIQQIDGLRGIAVFSVIFLHFYVHQFSEAFQRISPNFLTFCEQSSWGVDLFFVISGFLIGGILQDRVSSSRGVKAFYLRRAFRILPLYYALVLIAFAPALSGSYGAARIPLLSYLFFFQNVSKSFGLIPVPILGPLWSLAVEEHFYLLAPLAFSLMNRRGLILGCLSLIVISPWLRGAVAESHFAFHHAAAELTPCRLDPIALGILGSVLWRTGKFRSFWADHAKLLFCATALLMISLTFASIPPMHNLTAWLGPWLATLH